MITKIVRILLIFLALVGLIAGMAVLAFKVFLPDEKIREFFVNSGRWYLQREVSLQHLSLGLISGLELGGLEVAEKPNFKAGRFFSIGRVHCTVLLLPLLRHEVRVGELVIENPQVHIARAKNGIINFEDLRIAYGSSEQTGDVIRAAVPMPFRISELQVTGGTLRYSDVFMRDLHLALRDIAISARDLSAYKPFEARLSCVMDGKKSPLRIGARVIVDVPNDRVEIKEASLTSGDRVLAVTGAVGNVTGDGPVKLVLEVEGDPAVLESFAAVLPLQAELSLFPLPRVHARISGTTRALSVRFIP